jgi:Xaa-Pro dipeptidase
MRAASVLEMIACDAFVASDPATVAWLTGFAADETWGPNPGAVAPLAVIRSDASVVAVVSDGEAPALARSPCEIMVYEGFTMDALDPAAGRAAALAALGLAGRVGVDDELLALPRGVPEPIDTHVLRLLRAVKDVEEIELVRAAIRVCDVGQAAAREALRAGISELEAWASVQAAMERAAGERLSLLCDFVAGDRTADAGGPPGPGIVRDGDLAIVDLVPRLAGYFGDSCSTIAIGEVPAEIRSAHARCMDALERGLAAVQPGVRAGDLDALVREGLDYPHHTGHGVGTAAHEEPRIVPGSETVLAPGMIVALEPGLYPGPWGMRVERLALVTDAGCEVLSAHDLSL